MAGQRARLQIISLTAAIVIGTLGIVGNSADILSLFTTIGLVGTAAVLAAAVGIAAFIDIFRARHYPSPQESPRSERAIVAEKAIGVTATVMAVVLATLAILQAPAGQGNDNPGAAASTTSNDQRLPIGTTAATPVLGFEFWQDGARPPVRTSRDPGYDVAQVRLQPKPFEIHLPRRGADVGVRIVAWLDRSIFDLANGRRTADTSYFRPGTGYADHSYGETGLFLGKEGHNHFARDRIVDAVGNSPQMEKFFVKSIRAPQSEIFPPGVALTIFIDKNSNTTIDDGEYEYAELEFQ
ncbi:hypothetical protein NONI108955_12390 [Nocardia ninae]|uniref:Uncharacterized protein n=1 Tax=Nocardia ninae NBRC 108245 TaxID=1210091 RepID=A0A511MLI0_9NOCA|nr:hypothetical protein [Nocardia ninae]GEM40998.1 hypothetical protein NN4_55170 [Nocardia ninae NBRC 108245]